MVSGSTNRFKTPHTHDQKARSPFDFKPTGRTKARDGQMINFKSKNWVCAFHQQLANMKYESWWLWQITNNQLGV